MISEFDKTLLQYCSQDVLNEATKLTSDKSTTLGAANVIMLRAIAAHKIIKGEQGFLETLKHCLKDGRFSEEEEEEIEKVYGHLGEGAIMDLLKSWLVVYAGLGWDRTVELLGSAGIGATYQAISDAQNAIFNGYEGTDDFGDPIPGYKKINRQPQANRGDEQEALKKIRKKAAESGLTPDDLRSAKSRDQESDNYRIGHH
jgi:hypothetical protein